MVTGEGKKRERTDPMNEFDRCGRMENGVIGFSSSFVAGVSADACSYTYCSVEAAASLGEEAGLGSRSR